MIGAGGLGSAAALALAAAGVERLGLADADTVALSNLQRQVLYQKADIGLSKVAQSQHHLSQRQPGLTIRTHPIRLEGVAGISEVAEGYRVIIDGSDNFATRFAANDAALALNRPLVHGAVVRFQGQVMSVVPGSSPCLRCLFGAPPPVAGGSCVDEGVLGPMAGELGWLMAMEAVKLLRGEGKPLLGRLLTIDGLRGIRREVPFRKHPRCPACS
ncbi:MAG: HesA/MoeB/ThiF family protein [Magnetococcales bacterium]|nr:HesA/MoeB/ThiF family protein [Magnetococcales bacterium]